jgi:phosphoribosylglycinamide formyltransferase-1
VVDHKAQPRASLRRRAGAAIDGFEPDLVVLAGFMRILGAGFVQRYEGAAEHPPLAAAGLPGPAHAPPRARSGLQAGGRHRALRDAELDHGPIVMQSAVPVLPRRRRTTLSARVLATEHVIYPLAVRWFVEDKLRLSRAACGQLDGASQVLM